MSELGASGEDDRPCAAGTTRVQKRWMEEVETAVLKRPRAMFHRHSLVLVARESTPQHITTAGTARLSILHLAVWPHVRVPLVFGSVSACIPT